MELVQKDIHMDRIKCETDAQVTLEDDINITDSRPDVYQLVTEQGEVEIEEVRALEDHVHVRGKLRFMVLYISEEEVHRPACMEGELPFEEKVFLEGVASGDSVTVKGALEDLSVGMINSRKLSVQALANVKISVEVTETTRAAVGISGDESVEVLKKTIQAMHLAIQKKDIFRVREEMELPGGMPNIFQVLWQSCQLRDVSFRIMDEKMSVQGEIGLFLLYEGEGENRPAMWYEVSVPINGQVECQGMREGMLDDIGCRIGHRELEVKPDADGEERKLALELVLDLDMKLYEEAQIELLSDLYGVTKEIEAVKQAGHCKQLLAKNTGKMKVGGRLKVEQGLPSIQQLCGSMGTVTVGSVELVAEGLKLTGAVDVRIVYTTQDMDLPFYCLRGSLPFSYTLEVQGAQEPDCIYRVEPSLEQLTVSMLDAQEADVKTVVSFHGLVCKEHEEPVVTDLKISELDQESMSALPGIVAYIAREGDTLWSIGKRYYVPVESMKEMNELTGDEIKPGEKLLIVKGF